MMKELDKIIEKCTITIDENGIIKQLNVDTIKFPAQRTNIGKKVGDYFSKMNGNKCKIIKIVGEEIIIVVEDPKKGGSPDPDEPDDRIINIIDTFREEGKRMIYWVFQGQSFDREYLGGYIWAPKYLKGDKNSKPPHYWARLVEVQKGDIILHGCKGELAAVSVVQDKFFDCKQPKELEREGLWDADGRMVKCEYTSIKNPIKTSDYKKEIIEKCNYKYSPFDKNGDGNMGYLFELPRDIAKLFIKETVKSNKSLTSLEHIKELLEET